jgi:hypothetical protein
VSSGFDFGGQPVETAVISRVSARLIVNRAAAFKMMSGTIEYGATFAEIGGITMQLLNATDAGFAGMTRWSMAGVRPTLTCRAQWSNDPCARAGRCDAGRDDPAF